MFKIFFSSNIHFFKWSKFSFVQIIKCQKCSGPFRSQSGVRDCINRERPIDAISGKSPSHVFLHETHQKASKNVAIVNVFAWTNWKKVKTLPPWKEIFCTYSLVSATKI